MQRHSQDSVSQADIFLGETAGEQTLKKRRKKCTARSKWTHTTDACSVGSSRGDYRSEAGEFTASFMAGFWKPKRCPMNVEAAAKMFDGEDNTKGCEEGVYQDAKVKSSSTVFNDFVLDKYTKPSRAKRGSPVWAFNASGTTKSGHRCTMGVEVAVKVCPRESKPIIRCTAWPKDDDDDGNLKTANKQCVAELCSPSHCPHGQLLASLRTELLTPSGVCVPWFMKADALQRIKFGFRKQYHAFLIITKCFPWFATGAEPFDKKVGCSAQAHRRRGKDYDNNRGCGCGSKRKDSLCERRKCRDRDCSVKVDGVHNGKSINMCYGIAAKWTYARMFKHYKVDSKAKQEACKSKFGGGDKKCICDGDKRPCIGGGN